jgi:dolichol-phosphate mannosyltransferase
MNTAVCITTHNEAANIGALVESIITLGYDPIVIDEGSNDNTLKIAGEMGADVLAATHERGIGQCLMSAWRFAYQMNYARVAQLDAGESHNPGELPRLLKASEGHDVVIGSRFLPASEYNGRPNRRNLSRLYAHACNLLSGAKFTDWTSGYRIFSRHAIDTLLAHEYKALMHSWQAEVLSVAYHSGLSITERPITYHAGDSAFNRSIALEAIYTLRHIAAHKGDIDAHRIGVNLPQ